MKCTKSPGRPASPWTPLGSLQRSPRPPSWQGRKHPLPKNPIPRGPSGIGLRPCMPQLRPSRPRAAGMEKLKLGKHRRSKADDKNNRLRHICVTPRNKKRKFMGVGLKYYCFTSLWRNSAFPSVNTNGPPFNAKLLSSVAILTRALIPFYSARNCIASAVLARAIPSVCPSVCLSLRLSHAGIVSKRRHVTRCSFHRWIAKCV